MEGGKRIGIAIDFSPCSKDALIWAVKNLCQKGDKLIVVTVCPNQGYEQGEMQLWEATGTPLIPFLEFPTPEYFKKYGIKADYETLDILTSAVTMYETEVLLKIYWGDPREKICEAVDSIPLSCLVIGNRGLGKLKRVIMGSVSNYVVNNASCPVTVVKPQELFSWDWSS